MMGGSNYPPILQEKLPSKSPALLGLIVFVEKQKCSVKSVNLVTDDGSYDWKAF